MMSCEAWLETDPVGRTLVGAVPVAGEDTSSDPSEVASRPDGHRFVAGLVDLIERMWSVDAAGCPAVIKWDQRIERLVAYIEQSGSPDVPAPYSRATPEQLLARLHDRPDLGADDAVCHGAVSMGQLAMAEGRPTALMDWSWGGRGPRVLDLTGFVELVGNSVGGEGVAELLDGLGCELPSALAVDWCALVLAMERSVRAAEVNDSPISRAIDDDRGVDQ